MNYSKLYKLTWTNDDARFSPYQFKFFSNRTDAEKELREIEKTIKSIDGTPPELEIVNVPKLKHELIKFLNGLNND